MTSSPPPPPAVTRAAMASPQPPPNSLQQQQQGSTPDSNTTTHRRSSTMGRRGIRASILNGNIGRESTTVPEKPSRSSYADDLPLHERPPVHHKHDDGNGMSTLTPRIKAAGESGRRGFHPWHFVRIAFRSSCKASMAVNFLWPVVPAAIVVKYTTHAVLAKFILAYISMVPCANLVGFAGQELGRKLPHVLGVLAETTFGGIVELILFLVLLSSDTFQESVIKAAILGSILANMLLCLGACFFAAGMKREESHFSEAVSEAGTGLLLTAGFGLAVPTLFNNTFANSTGETAARLAAEVLSLSRITAVALLLAYFIYIWHMGRTHHGIYEAVFEMDEARDRDAHRDAAKPKLTLTECIVALVISITLVTIIAFVLVGEIPKIVASYGVSDSFMGLILVPLVEKAAEHLTAVDEAYDNQMNFALSHVLGATLQTALFNGPVIVIVGWGLNKDMGLDFDTFNLAVLILAILTVGNFLRDQKSNYLEGALCVIVYVIVAAAAFYNPTPGEEHGTSSAEGESTSEAATAAAAAVVERAIFGS